MSSVEMSTDEFAERVRAAYGSLRQASIEWGYDPSYCAKLASGQLELRNLHLQALRSKEQQRSCT